MWTEKVAALIPGAEQVPFVGCASDGQTGTVAMPQDRGNAPDVSRFEAKYLAYYATNDIGVLAPRGWHCVGLAGANGYLLVVTPELHSANDLLKSSTPLRSSAIQITFRNGATSGRFEVAQIAARLFENQLAYVQRIIAEGVMSKSNFPFGSYPYDVLRRKNERAIEFTTPRHQEGMGTTSRLAANGDPIFGLAIMPVDQNNSLVLVDVRVPQASKRLVKTILESVQHRYDLVR